MGSSQQTNEQQTEAAEIVVTVRRRSREPRIDFEAGTQPPRVASMHYDSYMSGKLYVGDVLLSVNDKEINTAEEFFAIVRGGSLEELRELKIRLRRDPFYQFLPERVIERTEERVVLDKQIKWRRGGMPLGVSMTEKNRRVTIDEVEAGAIATGHLKYGDIITQVDGVQTDKIEATRKAILHAINKNSAVTLRIERPLKKERSNQTAIPDDIKKILGHEREFYQRRHKRVAATDKQEERQPTTNSLYSSVTQRTNEGGTEEGIERGNGNGLRVNIQKPTQEDVQIVPVDNQAEPKRTPPRPGSEKREDKDRGK